MLKIDKITNLKELLKKKEQEIKALMKPGKNYRWLIQRFTQISNRAIIDPNLKPIELRVYCVVVMHMMKGEKCFPSYKTIAKEANIKKRHTINSINGLISKGYIFKTQRTGKTNLYVAKIK